MGVILLLWKEDDRGKWHVITSCQGHSLSTCLLLRLTQTTWLVRFRHFLKKNFFWPWPGHVTFPVQELNLHHGHNQSHWNDNTRSLTRWATRKLHFPTFNFLSPFPLHIIPFGSYHPEPAPQDWANMHHIPKCFHKLFGILLHCSLWTWTSPQMDLS